MLRSSSSFARRAAMGLALVASLSFAAGDAFARAGSGKSSGSRGTMSQKAPPTTDTAPRTAQPLPGAQSPAAGMSAGAGAAAAAAAPSRMRSLMTGVAAGFLGAGLFGLLSGSGFFSGMGSLLGILGMLAQVALVFFVVRWAFNYFRNRQAAPAGMTPGHARQPLTPEAAPTGSHGAGSNGAGPMAAAMGAAPQAAPAPLQLQERDFTAFERLLGEVQTAFSRADRTALHVRATPEMVADFVRDLEDMDKRGLVNRLSDIKLLQGDLAEAWREPGAEYATVAMRFSLIDAKVDKATGKVVEGDSAQPQEATELWTFVRRPGETSEGWKLSAIQQA